MIKLPDFNKAFEYENNFYLSCGIKRISKVLAHYELYKIVQDIPGTIVECGVFKGAALTRWAMFREILGNPYAKKIIGFDTFDTFPETTFEDDKEKRKAFINSAGSESISKEQLELVLKNKGIEIFVELVEGDMIETVPEYVRRHPELKISLLNLDTDIYEPTVTVLKYLFPLIVPGGILIIDDYGVFPGETKAVDDFFQRYDIRIKKLPFCMTPCYLIKGEKEYEWYKV